MSADAPAGEHVTLRLLGRSISIIASPQRSPASPKARRAHRFVALNGMRGLAALVVCCSHMPALLGSRNRARNVYLLIAPLLVSAAALIPLSHHFATVSLGWQTDLRVLGGLARVGYSFTAGLLIYSIYQRWPLRLPCPAWAAAA